MKSFVPYGPFLIAGTLWAILVLPAAVTNVRVRRLDALQ